MLNFFPLYFLTEPQPRKFWNETHDLQNNFFHRTIWRTRIIESVTSLNKFSVFMGTSKPYSFNNLFIYLFFKGNIPITEIRRKIPNIQIFHILTYLLYIIEKNTYSDIILSIRMCTKKLTALMWFCYFRLWFLCGGWTNCWAEISTSTEYSRHDSVLYSFTFNFQYRSSQ